MRRLLVALALVAALTALPAAHAATPPVGHVFVVFLENKNYVETFGANTDAPYFAGELAKRGQLLTQYHGIGHLSLDNYLAVISGQGPNPQTQADCQRFTEFAGAPGLDADGQAVGQGCVYPPSVKTLADQLTERGLRWKGYMQDMGSPCRHPEINGADNTQQAKVGDQYAARHNPFVYFHSIIDGADCARHDVPLSALPGDLASADRTAQFSFITPNLCEDGHDAPCVDGRPGGLKSADAWLRTWIPQILASPAFQKDGMLVVTFDEAEAEPPEADASACCDEPLGPNTPNNGGPVPGRGGGRIGAVVVSPFVTPGSVNPSPYNHYALLRTVEDLFGLAHLGFAGRPGLRPFGDDVFGRASAPQPPEPSPSSRAGSGGCATATPPAFGRVRGRGRGLRVALDRRAGRVGVRLLKVSGRTAGRHRPARGGFSWRPRVRPGIYVLELTASGAGRRRVVRLPVRHAHGRFRALPPFARAWRCGALASATLGRPVFHRSLRLRYRLRAPAATRAVVRSHGRVLARRSLPSRPGSHRVRLAAPRSGRVTVRVVAGGREARISSLRR